MRNVKGYNSGYAYKGFVDGNYNHEFVSDKEYWEMIGYQSYPNTNEATESEEDKREN